MCDPVSAIMVATAVVGYVAADEQATKSAQAVRANQEVASKTMETQQWQARGNAAEQMSERAKSAMQERGRLAVIGADSGLGGNLTDKMYNNSAFNEGQDITSIQRNARNTSQQQDLQQLAISTNAQGQYNTIKQASALGAGLQIAGGYYDQQAKAAKPKV